MHPSPRHNPYPGDHDYERSYSPTRGRGPIPGRGRGRGRGHGWQPRGPYPRDGRRSDYYHRSYDSSYDRDYRASPYNYEEDGNSHRPYAYSSHERDIRDTSQSDPVRTLFVRHIKGIRFSKLQSCFERFGELHDLCDQSNLRGFAFFTYYDLRAAIRAQSEMNYREVDGVTIEVRYSFPKTDEALTEYCDRTKNQGTILVTARDCPLPIPDQEVRSYFEQFGDVMSVRRYRTNERQRCVEFYDSRACLRAHDRATGSAFRGGTLDCRFLWDRNNKNMTRQAQEAKQLAHASDYHYSSSHGRAAPRDYSRPPYSSEEYYSRRDYSGEPYRHQSPRYRRANGRDDYYDRPSYGPSHRSPVGSRHQQSRSPSPARSASQTAPPVQGLDSERLQQAQQAQQVLSLLASQMQPHPSNPPNNGSNGVQASQVNQLVSLLAQAQALQQQQASATSWSQPTPAQMETLPPAYSAPPVATTLSTHLPTSSYSTSNPTTTAVAPTNSHPKEPASDATTISKPISPQSAIAQYLMPAAQASSAATTTMAAATPSTAAQSLYYNPLTSDAYDPYAA
ncbi:hypothetical protein H4R35_002346 [Dimargaris xerosporica]|nr:hypothetical protein H4R35_002346 [Dimargaris xerosporica]